MWVKRRNKSLINLQNIISIKIDNSLLIFTAIDKNESFVVEFENSNVAEQTLTHIVDAIKVRQNILFI